MEHFYLTEEQWIEFLDSLEREPKQLKRLKRLLNDPSILELCQCKEDWTDGTFYCQACHKERRRKSGPRTR